MNEDNHERPIVKTTEVSIWGTTASTQLENVHHVEEDVSDDLSQVFNEGEIIREKYDTGIVVPDDPYKTPEKSRKKFFAFGILSGLVVIGVGLFFVFRSTITDQNKDGDIVSDTEKVLDDEFEVDPNSFEIYVEGEAEIEKTEISMEEVAETSMREVEISVEEEEMSPEGVEVETSTTISTDITTVNESTIQPLITTTTSTAPLTCLISKKGLLGATVPVFSASASSELYWEGQGILYSAAWAIDGDTSTSWQEGSTSNWGINESLTVNFDSEVTLSYISLLLGNQNTQAQYEDNGRPKALFIEFSNGENVLAEFADSYNMYQTVILSHAVKAQWVRFTIMSVYTGNFDMYSKDTCITEIRFLQFVNTDQYQVVYNGVSIRKGAGQEYDAFGTYSVGEKVTLTGISDDGEWGKIQYNGNDAWIAMRFLTPIDYSWYNQ